MLAADIFEETKMAEEWNLYVETPCGKLQLVSSEEDGFKFVTQNCKMIMVSKSSKQPLSKS